LKRYPTVLVHFLTFDRQQLVFLIVLVSVYVFMLLLFVVLDDLVVRGYFLLPFWMVCWLVLMLLLFLVGKGKNNDRSQPQTRQYIHRVSVRVTVRKSCVA